mmetsp:Transcript_41686/g.104048  ORF Transcript_41686/g.104048 Transcript_41686/m.104048 type:complete len:324 (-) Transcript_41686:106-1077(-)
MLNQSTSSQGRTGMNLAAAKEARKRAELDAQLLANRIALLKQEEEKAWKKIDDTRKKTKEMLTLRTTNEQKLQAKDDYYRSKYQSVRDCQQHNALQRDRARATREATQMALLRTKQTGVRAMKQQTLDHVQEKREKELLERQHNWEKTQMIRQQKEEHRRKLEAEKQARLDRFREEYESRVRQEDLLRARTEALVAKMEKEEMELIARLHNTQVVQRGAYEELETALGETHTRSIKGSLAQTQHNPELSETDVLSGMLRPTEEPPEATGGAGEAAAASSSNTDDDTTNNKGNMGNRGGGGGGGGGAKIHIDSRGVGLSAEAAR